MEKEFVTYEIALALKELGFDEPCFGWYNYDTLWLFGEDNLLDCYAGEEKRPLAPTYSQSFRFFREKYKLDSFCKQIELKGKSYWKINKIETPEKIKGYSNFTDSYEQAELECLKKLVEIAKEQNVK